MHVGRGVVARAGPVDAAGPDDIASRPADRAGAGSTARNGPSPTTTRRTFPECSRCTRSNARSIVPSPFRGSKRPEEEDHGLPVGAQRGKGLGIRREVVLVDPVRDHPPLEVGEVRRQRPDARLGDDDVRVQLRERPAHQRGQRVEPDPAREDGVVGADADRALRHHERRERREAGVVRGVHVHHVELPATEEDAHGLPQKRRHGVQGLGVVPVHRNREPDVDDLERLLTLRSLVAVDDCRGVQQPTRDDGHLVAAPRPAASPGRARVR